MEAKNVLIVYLGKIGGPSAFSFELACGFAKAGHNVYALLSNANEMKDSWDKHKEIQSIYIYTGDTKRIVSASFNMEFNLRGKLKYKYKDVEFDYVIYTMPHPWSYRIGSAFRTKKHVMFCHDPIAHSSAWQVYRIISDYLLKKCDEIFVLTKSFIPIIEKNFGVSSNHVHFVPHGRMSIYKDNDSKSDNNTETDCYNFIFFGNITGYKGLNILGKAYRLLLDEPDNGKEYKLTIAGRGDFSPFREVYDGLPSVQLENRFIPDDEVAEIFRKPNSILILPYLDATQSGVIPIAMEFGVPVIASDTGGLREQLNDGELGVLFECGNEEALKNAMKNMTEHPELVLELKKKTKSYLHKLNWDNIAHSMVEQIERSTDD